MKSTLTVVVGHAKVTTRGYVGIKKIRQVVKLLGEENPEGDVLRVTKSGISIGKRITPKRIIILTGTMVGIWYGGKLLYKILDRRLNGSSQNSAKGKEDGGPTGAPVNQSLEEIRNKTMEGHNGNYDADQLIGEFLCKGDRAIVYSPYGVGKTVFCFQMAIDISEGKVSLIAPHDNGVHSPQKVIYYDGEMDDTDIWKIIGSRDLSTLSNFTRRSGGYYKNVEQWLNDVKVIIKNTPGDITIFLDNITSVFSTINAETIRELFLLHLKGIQDEQKKLGRAITFVVVAHTTKQQTLAGSNNLGNFASTILGLYKKGSTQIILKIDKCRKYGDNQGKQYLLEKKQTSEGYKFDENIGEYKGETKESESSDDIPPSATMPVWEGKLSLSDTIEMKAFYQEGVDGHGWMPTAVKFGLTDHKAVKKEFERLEKYLEALDKKPE